MNIPPARVSFSEEDRHAILARIDESLKSGMLTTDRNVREFEEAFSGYLETPHVVAVNSGSAALEIGMRILGVVGRKVLVPTNTFFATPASVTRAGGLCEFVDSDPETFSINVDHLKKCIGPDTAGVIVVHIGGIVTPRMLEIRRICDENGLFLFEDCAHAHGSMWGYEFAGKFGDMAAFSFFPTKIITSAEGGILVTRSKEHEAEAFLYRDQGKRSASENVHNRLGSNWRMSEPHAAIGIQHLSHLSEFIEERNEIAGFYDEALSGIFGVSPLKVPDSCFSNCYKYIALLDEGENRTAIKRRMKEEFGVSLSGEVYETPCHLQPYFSDMRNQPLPVAEDICARHICLPIYSGMKEEEMYHVAHSLSKVMGK